MNWFAKQHDSRRDGGSRSYHGRVAQVVRARGIMPLFVASDCAGKPVGLEGRAWESPG